jgi:hypothetical protein
MFYAIIIHSWRIEMIDNNIYDHIKNSYLGQFIKSNFFLKVGGFSEFEKTSLVTMNSVEVLIDVSYINQSIPNNPFSDIIKEFKTISDLKEFYINLEFYYELGDDEIIIEDCIIRAGIHPSDNTRSLSFMINLSSIKNMEYLQRELKRLMIPDYCQTVREKIIYVIFEYDEICREFNIDKEFIIKNYANIHTIINDYKTVKQMNKI